MFKFAGKVLVLSYTLLFSAAIGVAAETKTDNSKLSKADSQFVMEAAQGGLMEVQLGKLAQEKASHEKVKEFGKRMEQDHGKTNSELKKIAADKGIQLPDNLDKKHKSKVDKLAKLSGANFDRQYMQEMVSDHKADIKKFERQADKGKDPDLQKLAGQTLPTLKEHLQLAESTSREIKGAGKAQKN